MSLVSDHYELASDWSNRTMWPKYWPLIGQCLSTLPSDWLMLVTPVAEGSSVVMTFTHKLVGLGFVIKYFKEFMISGIQLRRFVSILQHIISHPGLNLVLAPLDLLWYSGWSKVRWLRLAVSKLCEKIAFQFQLSETYFSQWIDWKLWKVSQSLTTSCVFECESFKVTVDKLFKGYHHHPRIIFTVAV